jgi:hypothetical protein
MAPRVLDELAIVLGHLPYALVLKLIGRMMKGGVPEHRHAALAAQVSGRSTPVVHHDLFALAIPDPHPSGQNPVHLVAYDAREDRC